MTAFILLLATFGVLQLASVLGMTRFASTKRNARIAMAIMFVVGGALHFIIPEPYQLMMPQFLPFHLELVYISGAAEVLLGIGLLFAKYQRLVAYGIIALLVAIFPANIYVAMENIQLGGFLSSSLYQWIRLPVQFLLIWWALWCTSPGQKRLS